jgi:hypothetical protein
MGFRLILVCWRVGATCPPIQLVVAETEGLLDQVGFGFGCSHLRDGVYLIKRKGSYGKTLTEDRQMSQTTGDTHQSMGRHPTQAQPHRHPLGQRTRPIPHPGLRPVCSTNQGTQLSLGGECQPPELIETPVDLIC